MKRDTSVDTGPGFTFVDQNGTTYTASSYPPPAGAPITASGSGTLPLVVDGGAGPLSIPTAASTQALAGVVKLITPAPAANAVEVPIPVGRSAMVIGAPRLSVTYHGTTGTGTALMRVFAQLVDTTTGLVLGNQITPVPVDLDGSTHSTSVPLEIVAYTAGPSSHLELQLVATTVAYSTPRLGGSVTFNAVHLVLPTVTGLQTEAAAPEPRRRRRPSGAARGIPSPIHGDDVPLNLVGTPAEGEDGLAAGAAARAGPASTAPGSALG